MLDGIGSKGVSKHINEYNRKDTGAAFSFVFKGFEGLRLWFTVSNRDCWFFLVIIVFKVASSLNAN